MKSLDRIKKAVRKEKKLPRSTRRSLNLQSDSRLLKQPTDSKLLPRFGRLLEQAP